MTGRPNLVIVRAGDTSLHPAWLAREGGPTRNWDLIVSYFGDDAAKYRSEDERRIDGKGPKWPALYGMLREHEALVRAYEYVWLPDDDLACTGEDINRLFDICRAERLQLAQPSLTPDSYYSHLITLHNPHFRVRYASYVEIMAPCFHRDALWKLVPTFNRNLSGWGLDSIWPGLLHTRIDEVAVIDQVQIRHTREIGAANYQALKAHGIQASDERDEVLREHGLSRTRYLVRGGLHRFGERPLPDGWRVRALYLLGLLRIVQAVRRGRRDFLREWLSAVGEQLKG